MLERERPYTHEEVKTLYPVLTEVEARMVAHIEQHHTNPQWQVWPHADYPQVHLWLARRSFTPMPPLVVRELGDMPGGDQVLAERVHLARHPLGQFVHVATPPAGLPSG